MNSLTASSVETYVTTQVTNFSEAAAAVIGVTVVVGLAIFLVFKGLKWLKGSL